MSIAPPEDDDDYMEPDCRRDSECHDVHRDGPFRPTNVVAEPLTLYRSGGYHQVHLGDIMRGGRYMIVHKLGWGFEGTIWLARDRK